jgi:chromosome segregation ATPase
MTAAVTAAPKPTRIQRIPAVDRKYYEQKIDELDSEIKELKKKTDSLSKEISTKSEGKDNFFAQKDAIKADLDAAQNKLTELEKKRNHVQEQIKKILQTDKDSRTEMQKMQKDIGFQSEEQIDKQIADIEYQMHTESLTLKREKELMMKIAQLKQVKPQLNKLTKMRDAQSSGTTGESVGSLKVQLAEIQKDLAAAKEVRQKHAAALGKLTDARKKSMSGVSHIFEERDKLNAEIKKKLSAMKALKDERSEKIKAFNEHIASQKEIRAERDKVEKAAKDAEREVRKREQDLEKDNLTPFQQELDLIENMVKYCEKLQPAVASAGPITKAPVTAIEGTDVLVSKKEREEVFFVAPSKKAAAKKESSSVSTDKPITHSLETIGLFAEIKVSPPTAVKDISGIIEQLKKKTEEFKTKQVKETEDRKAKRSEREAALKVAQEAYEKAAAEARKFAPKNEEDF